MFLRGKIHASSLAEVVIALAVIALCFGIASLIFIRFTLVSSNYQFIQKQTEIQSLIWRKLQDKSTKLDIDDVEINEEQDDELEFARIVTATDRKGKIIWKQQIAKDE